MRVFKPLNYIPYIKKDAEQVLEDRFGWKSFKHKHHESRFTRFYEDFWLPKKFGYDKRKAHFSSLILTNQMTREDALIRIKSQELTDDFHEKEFNYIADKLDLSKNELQRIFDGKNKTFRDYRSKIKIINFGAKVLTKLGIENRLFR